MPRRNINIPASLRAGGGAWAATSAKIELMLQLALSTSQLFIPGER